MRYTENITELKENEVFVFGSNLSGLHGAGAARTAQKWGAKYGQGVGLQGQTYALPTVYYGIKRPLTIDEIRPYVEQFIKLAMSRPELTFLLTEVGCGLAGHKVEDIAPLFKDTPTNVIKPKSFY